MSFRCSICGETHDASEMSWNFPEPVPWLIATEEERARSWLTDDQCELVASDAVHYFIRAQLENTDQRHRPALHLGCLVLTQ